MITPLAGPVTISRVMASEWTKFRSLRSTWWCLAVTAAASVGIGVLVSVLAADDQHPATAPVTVAGHSQLGGLVSQLIIGVLAAAFIAGEYSTGMIRSSLIAVPRRLLVLGAKMGVFAAVALPVTVLSSLAAYGLGQVAWRAKGWPAAPLTDPGVARVVFGAAVCITLTGLCALAIGALVRSTAASVATVVGVFFVAPILASLMPHQLANLSRLLPSNASGAVWQAALSPVSMTPASGFALLCGYTAALGLAAALRLRHGDA